MLKSITFKDTYLIMYEYIKKSYEELYEELYEDNEPDNMNEDYFLLFFINAFMVIPT